MRVLALDPGDRVGWARADVTSDGSWSDLRHGITPLKDMAKAVHGALVHFDQRVAGADGVWRHDAKPVYDVVVMEEWRLYPHRVKEFSGSAFPSVQFIGAVKLCCWVSGTKLVMQGAKIKQHADVTMAKTNPDLHALVTRTGKHDDLHDMDAIRHLHYWTWRNFPPIQQEAA